MSQGLMLTRFLTAGSQSTLPSASRSRRRPFLVTVRFQLRFVAPATPATRSRIGVHRIKAPRQKRVAVLCQVDRSDHFFYKPNGGTGDEEPFTKEELELAEIIEALEPYDRSPMLPHVSVEAMDAIQKTASGMLGMLPPSQFQVQIRSLRDPLANLVFSSLCTGYALRNAEFRLQLQYNLLAEVEETRREEEEETAATLHVLDEKTLRKLPISVLDYIHTLESKIASFEGRQEESNEEKRGPSTNKLLQYVRGMHPDTVNKLSESAGRGVVHAFNLTVKRVVENLHMTQAYPSSAKLLGRLRSAMGEAEKQRITPSPSFTSTTFNLSRDNLTDALMWSMLVGYYTKGLESRMALERCLHDKDHRSIADKAWYLKLGSLFHDEQ